MPSGPETPPPLSPPSLPLHISCAPHQKTCSSTIGCNLNQKSLSRFERRSGKGKFVCHIFPHILGSWDLRGLRNSPLRSTIAHKVRNPILTENHALDSIQMHTAVRPNPSLLSVHTFPFCCEEGFEIIAIRFTGYGDCHTHVFRGPLGSQTRIERCSRKYHPPPLWPFFGPRLSLCRRGAGDGDMPVDLIIVLTYHNTCSSGEVFIVEFRPISILVFLRGYFFWTRAGWSGVSFQRREFPVGICIPHSHVKTGFLHTFLSFFAES